MNPGGRPTKYKEEFIVEVDKYLATKGKEQTSLPTKQGFALWIGVDDDTLVEWSKIHPLFSAALRKLMLRQAEQLIDDGIYGGKEVNPTIIKLLLQNNHGMREKTELTGENGEPIKLNIISGADYVSTVGAASTASTGNTVLGSTQI